MVRIFSLAAALLSGLFLAPADSGPDVQWQTVFTGTYADVLGTAPFSYDEPTVVASADFEAAWQELRPWLAGLQPEQRDRMVTALDAVDFRTYALIAVAAQGSCTDELLVTRITRAAAVISVSADRYDTTAPRAPGQSTFACPAISFFNFQIVSVPRWLVGQSPYAIAEVRTAAPETVEMGRGLGGWRLGMPYRTRPGLLSSRPYPRNRRSGCFGYPDSATRIDRYLGMRLAWTDGTLTNVATTLPGYGSETAFRIGTARFGDVSKRFPKAQVSRRRLSPSSSERQFALGSSAILVTRNTAWEAWVSTRYWFDRRGSLVALETLTGGC